jgi:hypothetical protein
VHLGQRLTLLGGPGDRRRGGAGRGEEDCVVARIQRGLLAVGAEGAEGVRRSDEYVFVLRSRARDAVVAEAGDVPRGPVITPIQ